MIDRKKEQPDDGEWLPIDTAPRDGSFVIVWPPTFRNVTSCARWDADALSKRPRPFWRRIDDLGHISRSRNMPPTHWRQPVRGPKGEMP